MNNQDQNSNRNQNQGQGHNLDHDKNQAQDRNQFQDQGQTQDRDQFQGQGQAQDRNEFQGQGQAQDRMQASGQKQPEGQNPTHNRGGFQDQNQDDLSSSQNQNRSPNFIHNPEQTENNWNRIRDQYRDRYPQLSPEDLEYRTGEFDTMTDRIAKKTNRTREDVTSEIDNWDSDNLGTESGIDRDDDLL